MAKNSKSAITTASTSGESGEQASGQVLLALMEVSGPIGLVKVAQNASIPSDLAERILRAFETLKIVHTRKSEGWELTPAFRILAKRVGRGNPSKWAEISSYIHPSV